VQTKTTKRTNDVLPKPDNWISYRQRLATALGQSERECISTTLAIGARGDRAEVARVIKRLQPGDVLVVTRLDRLARSTRDLLNVLEATKQAGAGFFAQGCLVRHDNPSWGADADGPGRSRRIRTDVDQSPDR
jgi:hypothetical protein